MSNENRVPRGVSSGGQFTQSTRGEAGVALAEPDGYINIAEAIAEAKATGKPVRVAHTDGNRFDNGVGNTACGDYSLGAEPSVTATWATGRDDEPFITVDHYAFVVAFETSTGKELDDHDLDEAYDENERAVEAGEDPPNSVRLGINTMTMWTAHTKLDAAGDTEVRSNVEYDTGRELRYTDVAAAESNAHQQILSEDFEHFHPENF